jgi:phosphatidylglycerophosphatase A
VRALARLPIRFKPGRLPPGLSFWHPLTLLCTWFGSGLLPKVPGTWGSAAALPFAALIQWSWGSGGLAVGAAAVFILGSFAAGPFARMAGIKDPGSIVVPLDPFLYGLSFVFFRVADILKPWPASWCDKRLAGGFGVMADDMVAGLYAAAALFLLARVLPWW